MRPIDADKYEYPGDLINEPTLNYNDIVPHGRWERDVVLIRGHFINRCKCSICKKEAKHETDYCPNCGAKMDGEK